MTRRKDRDIVRLEMYVFVCRYSRYCKRDEALAGSSKDARVKMASATMPTVSFKFLMDCVIRHGFARVDYRSI